MPEPAPDAIEPSPKRHKSWIPRFSLRILLTIPLLVALYFYLGEISRKHGADDLVDLVKKNHGGGRPLYVAPLLFKFFEMRYAGGNEYEVKVHYYCGVFGWVAKTPVMRTRIDTMSPGRDSNDIIRDAILSDWPPSST